MVKVIYADKKYNCDHLLGTFLNDSHYETLVDYDVDLYGPSMDGSKTEENIVAKFRKSVFSKEEQRLCYEGLRGAATQSQNRGIAAGPRGNRLETEGRGGRDWVTTYQTKVLEHFARPSVLLEDETFEDVYNKYHNATDTDETRGNVWLRSKVVAERGEYDEWFDKWVEEIKPLSREKQREKALYVSKNYISDTNYAQSVMSGVAGFYGRYPRIPWGRACAYNENNPEKFEKAFPYLSKLDRYFKELLPQRYKVQKQACKKIDDKFVIDDTAFTTLTVNHNWRTAAHLDAGDLGPGFSNISGVTGSNGWNGGNLVLPEYKVAVKLQPGDLLLVANHTAIHGNTPLIGDTNDRLTIVAYFREDLFEVKSWEYEQLRKKFVQERSKNKEHPDWKPLFNGVTAGMWESQEWADYLKKHNMKDEDGLVGNQTNLEEFF